MQALLDLAQTGAIIVTGGWLIYAVLRTRAEFNAAAARYRVELSTAKQSANKADLEHSGEVRPPSTDLANASNAGTTGERPVNHVPAGRVC